MLCMLRHAGHAEVCCATLCLPGSACHAMLAGRLADPFPAFIAVPGCRCCCTCVQAGGRGDAAPGADALQ